MDTVAGSKHRGLNRASWSMRVKPPAVAPAASALFEAAQGPRVLPGTYTVKLTKGDKFTPSNSTLLSIREPSIRWTSARRSSISR